MTVKVTWPPSVTAVADGVSAYWVLCAASLSTMVNVVEARTVPELVSSNTPNTSFGSGAELLLMSTVTVCCWTVEVNVSGRLRTPV